MNGMLEQFREKIKNGTTVVTIVDGLDASGKGELTKAMKDIYLEQSRNVILIDYPQYKTPWGKVLRYLLDINDLGLSIEERMAVYAINRLESIAKIVQTASELNSKLVLIFDRFATSNLITLAYYYANGIFSHVDDKQEIQDLLDHKREEIREYIEKIFEIDREFIELLGLGNEKICIPRINPEISQKRLQNDSTRKNIDSYEKPKIQIIADMIYGMAAEFDNSPLVIVEQNERDVIPIAQDIVFLYRHAVGNIQKPQFVHIELDENIVELLPEVNKAINNLLERYSRLKILPLKAEN